VRRSEKSVSQRRLHYPDSPALLFDSCLVNYPACRCSIPVPRSTALSFPLEPWISEQLLATPVHSPATVLTVLLRPTPVALICSSSFSAVVPCTTARIGAHPPILHGRCRSFPDMLFTVEVLRTKSAFRSGPTAAPRKHGMVSLVLQWFKMYFS
jgi:hypothetical protein